MIEHHHDWDAGDLGCGELVLGLRRRLRAHPGEVLRLVARDAGAPADLEAFCRMTGDEFLGSDPATTTFWLRARRA